MGKDSFNMLAELRRLLGGVFGILFLMEVVSSLSVVLK